MRKNLLKLVKSYRLRRWCPDWRKRSKKLWSWSREAVRGTQSTISTLHPVTDKTF